MTDNPGPPPPLLLGHQATHGPDPQPQTGQDRDHLVSVTLHGDRLIDARVDPRAPRERLGPAIIDAVNAALAAHSATHNRLMADAQALLSDSRSILTAGSEHADQILQQSTAATRELESHLDEAYHQPRAGPEAEQWSHSES